MPLLKTLIYELPLQNMAAYINTKELFQKEDYTNGIVKFGNEEIKCHRFVLCMRSKYFKTLLKPGSGFIVSEIDCERVN